MSSVNVGPFLALRFPLFCPLGRYSLTWICWKKCAISWSGWFPEASIRLLFSMNCCSFSERCSNISAWGRSFFRELSFSCCCRQSCWKRWFTSASLPCSTAAVVLSAVSMNRVTISRVASKLLFCRAMSCFSFCHQEDVSAPGLRILGYLSHKQTSNSYTFISSGGLEDWNWAFRTSYISSS